MEIYQKIKDCLTKIKFIVKIVIYQFKKFEVPIMHNIRLFLLLQVIQEGASFVFYHQPRIFK